MTRFIDVSLDDFEAQFNVPHKRDPNRRAFNLIKPEGMEAYYECTLRESSAGSLVIKVYTSVASDRKKARGVGEDAIRIAVIWNDKEGWTKAIGEKPKRVYRSGSETSTAKDVVERTFNRTKEVASETVGIIICERCGRPMVKREGKNGPFLGCIGFTKKVCSNTRNI